ncbi:MAG: ABC transporter permease [Bacteroidales bacterium]|nr:ABC transporter permease [Bacteroidales bacterium]
MNKINLIIKREYLTRVRKKSFVIMTILGPLLFGAIVIAPAWLANLEDKQVKKIAVIDSSKIFINKLPETEYIKFNYLQNTRVEDIKRNFEQTDYYALLYITHLVANTSNSVVMYSDQQPSLSVKSHISSAIEKELEQQKLRAQGIDDNILQTIKTNINIRTVQWTEGGGEKESSTELAMIVGYFGGFLIYFFIFLFGAQVMRGVIEEKTNRIVEIIVSSVKPFQLMMGKIIGIGLVGLTQFGLWVVLTLIIVTGAKPLIAPQMTTPAAQEVKAPSIMNNENTEQAMPFQETASQQSTEDLSGNIEAEPIFNALEDINFGLIIGVFIFFFLGGYLLYGSLFAAIGSAVDNETDTQQFMLPITIPLILAIIVLVQGISNPQGGIAFWFSIIPLTSPILMMARLPFGVPTWEVMLSMALLALTFIGTTWLSGKIYRTGILMYGKKVNYKELWKWIRYKI